MHIRHRGSWRKISAGLLAGIALIALSGCYPYYYDAHYSYGGGYYKHGHHGKRHYYDGGHYHRDRYKRERRKRYRYYHRY